ncbi:GNAT family N-acetyltransferase [Agromyces sp. SYSU K20354]|uniref:GNAT family N-acetyltransferase n=1 Tax=Agromyces cavernae TaxID=2898659 RepID=UPI001E30C4E5|nr:GNAT family N-acetyltransferase [Agromyces cavernae]MCD2444123.1 GNAT family N-acetyltransferase [Agromyces cavernae]
MMPVTLRTARLVLDLPVERDIELVTHYCQDPLFERFLTTPWPYTEQHARGFLTEYVPAAWESGSELTWALRTAEGGPLIGVISLRSERGELGFWLGAEHRGSAYMAEATNAVCEWALDGGLRGLEVVVWRANEGNLASTMVARAAGFRRTTPVDSTVPGRDGAPLPGWCAERGAVVDADAYASWEPILGSTR